jgi:hypothetical protein
VNPSHFAPGHPCRISVLERQLRHSQSSRRPHVRHASSVSDRTRRRAPTRQRTGEPATTAAAATSPQPPAREGGRAASEPAARVTSVSPQLRPRKRVAAAGPRAFGGLGPHRGVPFARPGSPSVGRTISSRLAPPSPHAVDINKPPSDAAITRKLVGKLEAPGKIWRSSWDKPPHGTTGPSDATVGGGLQVA